MSKLRYSRSSSFEEESLDWYMSVVYGDPVCPLIPPPPSDPMG
jgi:hypothetical protein